MKKRKVILMTIAAIIVLAAIYAATQHRNSERWLKLPTLSSQSSTEK